MNQQLKDLWKKLRKQYNVLTDYFNNPIEIGDVVIIFKYGYAVPGIVLSLPLNGIVVSCYRSLRTSRKYDRKTQSYVTYQSSYITTPDIQLNWHEMRIFQNVHKIIEHHNNKQYIRLYSKKGIQSTSVINLTKLNLIPNENLKD